MASASAAVASTSKSFTPPPNKVFRIGDEVSTVANGRLFFGSIKDFPNSDDKVNVKWIRDPLVTEVDLPSLQLKKNLLLTDRSLFKGCKVRAVADKPGLIGVCRSLLLQADLRILGTQTIIPAVMVQERVTPLKEFKQRSIVFYNGFIGVITDVERSVKARIISKDTQKSLVFKTFLAQSKNSASQNVELSWINELVQKNELSSSVSFSAEGDNKIFDDILSTEYVIYVEDLEVNKVVVNWKHNIDLEQPDKPTAEFKGDRLKKLLIVKEELSNESSYQCGNLGKFQVTHEDLNLEVLTNWDRNFVKKSYSTEKMDELQREYPTSLWSYLNEQEKEERIQPSSTSICVMIHKLTTTGDIMWQNGENVFEKSTDLLVENQSLFEDIFVCGDFVYSEKFMNESYRKVYGVVIKNNLAEKKVLVRVLTNESSPSIRKTIEIPEKFLKRHPRYMFLNQNDSIVVRVNEDKTVQVGNPNLTNLKGEVLVKWAKIDKEQWVYPFELSIYCTRGHDDIEQIFSKLELEEEDAEESEEKTDDNGNLTNSCPIPCKKPSLDSNLETSADEQMEVDEEPTNITNSIFLEKVDMSLAECPDIHNFFKIPFDTSYYNCFLKTIQRELKNLTELCPESMKIKGFANRIDLFSIAIAGPEDTPYENSLYLFDASLPSNYPNVPPKVHFHSCGAGRLNPNLYAEGKVCVSLLGTWSGKNDHEKWTKDSTLAQVLISIQALILNAHPYHNEPGWDRSNYKTEEEANSHSGPYNARLMPLVGKMIINQLQKPFEPWVDDIRAFYKINLPLFISRWDLWLSDQEIPADKKPKFSLNLETPGLKTSMQAVLVTLKELLANLE